MRKGAIDLRRDVAAMERDEDTATLPEKDYEEIESAVMETARGRWFLREYARRNRNADTAMLLRAMQKLETAMPEVAERASGAAGRRELAGMSAAIAKARLEIAAVVPPGGGKSLAAAATDELDGIARAVEKATTAIRRITGSLRKMAADLRENGAQARSCETLEKWATEIEAACASGDDARRRIARVSAVLSHLEKRLNAAIVALERKGLQLDSGAGKDPGDKPEAGQAETPEPVPDPPAPKAPPRREPASPSDLRALDADDRSALFAAC